MRCGEWKRRDTLCHLTSHRCVARTLSVRHATGAVLRAVCAPAAASPPERTIGSRWKRWRMMPPCTTLSSATQATCPGDGQYTPAPRPAGRLPAGAARVIDRLVISVVSAAAQPLERVAGSRSRGRVVHRSERGGVRRDDQVVFQSALESEARHTEGGVLIGIFAVAARCTPIPKCPRARRVPLPYSIWRSTASRQVWSSRL